MAPPPVVTGLSPNEGPPGTKITIRGEHFGNQPTDLIGLKVCGCDCLLSAEWKSSNKIIAISGPGKGKGDVIITTKFGGEGTCSVTFKGYYEAIGPMKESAVWVEESSLYVWGRHSLSPSSYQQEDPLGLSVEGYDKKFPEDDLMELFPNSTGDIASENFSPGWFLLENHHVTSFNDLQAGLVHLRRKVEGQKEGQLSFLKSNISSVVDQIDTIVSLKEKFQSDVIAYGTEPTLKLEKAIKESEREARKLFDDVLTRRDRAEKTRNALNVLARFRFLFCLPCVIERNIKKGDYDIVINDYMRVKNLFNKSDVPVFKTALCEIDKRVVGLQKMLHEKLVQMPISVDEQKRLIRHLVNLEAPYEPAWDAINSHSEYINMRMKHCYDEHKAAESVFIEELVRSKTSTSTGKFKYNSTPQDLSGVPESILFIEDLCEIVSELFPDLWKLGQAYFTGELHVKVESGRQVGFKHMVLSIMESFCKTLRAAIIPHTIDKHSDRNMYGTWSTPDSDLIKPWLPASLRYVRSAYSILIKLDLPSDALDIVFTLILDLRIHCMTVLFKQTAEQIELLGKQETWKIEFSGKHNGITELPVKFEQSVMEVIQIVRESVLMSEQREGSLLDNPAAHKELDKQVDSLLSVFHKVLSSLCSKKENDEDDECSPVVSQLLGTPTAVYRSHNAKTHVPIWEHRLLTTLANTQYTRTTVLKNLEDAFNKCGYPIPKLALDKCKNKLESLEKSVLELYLEEKSDPLVGTIEPSMYLERFDWDTKITATDIRPYVKECINNLIHVHCEINSISPALVNSVLPQVVQTIAEELYRLMVCVQHFSVAGSQQARADIRVLQDVFKTYSTFKAKQYFEDALEVIPTLQSTEAVIVEDIVLKCKSRMKLQLLCLSDVTTPTRNGPNKPV